MKKKLLVLLIALASTMMPNLATAIAIDVEGYCDRFPNKCIDHDA